MGISSQTNLLPLSVVPVGNQFTTPNNAPEKPDIEGQTSGKAGTSYNYTFNSVDPDGDNVYYKIRWGDGNTEIWDGPHSSGIDVEIAHTYEDRGTYTIQAKAKDTNGAASNWSSLEVTMPFNNALTIPLFLKFLERFPHAFQVLHYFFRLTS